MSATFQKHLNDARRRLQYPTRASCDDGILSPYCVDILDELVTKVGNTHEPSLIAFAPLTINANATTYALDDLAPHYGKARYLYTKNYSQRQHIELVSLEILTEQRRGGDVANLPTVVNAPSIPSAAAVYYDVDQGYMLEVAPVPAQSVTCELVYEPAILRPQTKQSQGFTLEQFDALVAAKTALRGLPHCQWRGLSRKEAKEQRAEIREMLLYDIGDKEQRRGLEYLLWQFSLTSFQKTNDNSIGFGKGSWW